MFQLGPISAIAIFSFLTGVNLFLLVVWMEVNENVKRNNRHDKR